ncbi:response regulator, partial [Bradyrhizobium sp. ERR14]|uniref:response regulator n=1 Tax=Bradyrhizobium sp. ERR14 TaxID=2663837 RepID=UPI001616BB37
MTGRFDSPGEVSNAKASTKAIVFLVEDDISMRRSLTNLFLSVGMDVIAFGSAREMLQSTIPDAISCLVLDVRLPGLSGLDYQT